MKLFFDNRIEMGDADLERIHQAVLFFATAVSVRAGAAWVGSNPECSIRRFAELRELGAIEVWAHEYEVAEGGYLVENQHRAIFPGVVDHVLTIEDLASASEEVDDVLRLDREAVYRAQTGATNRREGVGEIVQHRRTLLGMRLSDALLLDGLASLNSPTAGLTHAFETLVDDEALIQQTINVVVSRCGFGKLAGLSVGSMADCRKHLPAFREYVRGLVGQASPQAHPDEIANKIMAAYQDLLHKGDHGTLKDGVKGFGSEAAWDVFGALFPPGLAIKYLGKVFSFGKKRKDFKPFLLLANVHLHTHEADE